ncbi:hypothetical protein MUP56_03020, partial [Patescibacteria group bacterium]|nr:hypothetical protein [Patescibacteria group bacterium]
MGPPISMIGDCRSLSIKKSHVIRTHGLCTWEMGNRRPLMVSMLLKGKIVPAGTEDSNVFK